MMFFPAFLLVLGPEGDFGSWDFVWARIRTSPVALYIAGHPVTNALGDALEWVAAAAGRMRRAMSPARRDAGRSLDVESLDDIGHVDGFDGEEPLEVPNLTAYRPASSPPARLETGKGVPERPGRSAMKKKHTMFEDDL